MSLEKLLLLVCLLSSTLVYSQELPPVISFDPENYGGGSQNWGVSQNESGFIYVANNEGLLEFDGNEWVLYPSPNESVFRSVKSYGGRIYTGSYMDFGYWAPNPTGVLEYRSLAINSKSNLLPDEHFWNIILHENRLVFQSLNQLFLYDPETGETEVITPDNGIAKIFTTEQGLYFTDQRQQLFELKAGMVTSAIRDPSPDLSVLLLWETTNEILVQSATQGSFALEEGKLLPKKIFPFLRDRRLYSSTQLRDGGMAFGTVANGVYIVGADGTLRYHLDQVDGLTNNTVLSLFEDEQQNLWVGTDNGISCINLASPFRKSIDNTGQLGTVYSSAAHNNNLYLGSNQGLFVKSLNGNDFPVLVPGTRGQVWSLFRYQGRLFCGHDRGTFLIDGRSASPLSTASGTWVFHPVPGRPELLLQGNYYGLSVLELKNGEWAFRNKVDAFDYSARFLVARSGPEVYISHEYRGVYGLKLDADYRRVVEQQLYDRPAKGKNAGLVGFQDSIYYCSREGVFVLEGFSSGFRYSEELSEGLKSDNYVSGKMTQEDQRLWFFTKKSINYFQRGALSDELLPLSTSVSADLMSAKSGYENITHISGDTFLLGAADGYLLLALSAIPPHEHRLYLKAAQAYPAEGKSISLPLAAGGDIPATAHNIHLRLAVPSYRKYFTPRFQHRLLGQNDNWSDWEAKPTLDFPELAPGRYTLEVRSLLGRSASEEVLSYSFRILRPWYTSWLAIALYVLVAILLLNLLHQVYTRYYKKKARIQQEENERRIAAQQRKVELARSQLSNQQLQQDIESKNREMALATMNLVKKNELLQQIKENLLAKQSPQKNIDDVIRTIDRNIDEAETWSLFKEAFENADRDFFKKAKSLHPELTPNDLKLCAYLRLNLSSKEIAPLLNISTKSVEVKRYRLRKKMNLEHEAGLVDYILGM